jgi:hypothetical protein
MFAAPRETSARIVKHGGIARRKSAEWTFTRTSGSFVFSHRGEGLMTRSIFAIACLAALLCACTAAPLAAQTLDFGDVEGGLYKDSIAVVTNPLPVPITVTSTVIRHTPSSYTILFGAAPFTVPAGGQKQIGIRFRPLYYGVFRDTLDIVSSVGNGLVELLGEGVLRPVELASFSVERSGVHALLRWNTATETDNAGFEVQRRAFSPDGARELAPFTAIGFVAGHGSTMRAQRYEYADPIDAGLRASGARLAYRLRQIDLDGRCEFSPERELLVAPATPSLAAYPNPFGGELAIDVPGGGALLRIVDACGREVWRRSVAQAGGLRVPAGVFRPGAYFVIADRGSARTVLPVLRLGTD